MFQFRSLWVWLIALVTLFNVLNAGCASHMLRSPAQQQSFVYVPGEVFGEGHKGKVYPMTVNPDSQITINMWDAETGNKTLEIFRDRAAVYDAFGRVTTQIEDARDRRFNALFDKLLELALTEGLPRYDASRAARAEREANRGPTETQQLISELRTLISRMPLATALPNPPSGG